MTTDRQDGVTPELAAQWERWCREVAKAAGITRAELQARLDRGEAYLRITFTMKGATVALRVP